MAAGEYEAAEQTNVPTQSAADAVSTVVANMAEATIDLQQQVARLQALLEVSRQVHATTSEDEVLRSVLRIVVLELEMAGACFTGTDFSYGEAPDASTAPEACLFPLRDHEGELLTTLAVAPPDGRALTLYEVDFLQGLALQVGVAVENARNSERNLEWARVQKDLDAARNIQRSLVPRSMPDLPGFSLAVRSETCYEVGGDYVDVIALAAGDLILTVADVAGKGLASAIMASSFRAAFRAMTTSEIALETLAQRMNQHHWQEGEEARRRYVTAILVRLDAQKNELVIVNAGHNPGFVLTPDGEQRQIEASGTPLGMLPGITYSTERIAFPPGSRLLLYTDGLTEAFQGEEEFGQDRLLDAFSSSQTANSDAMLDSLWTAIREFSDGGPQTDDMTALTLMHVA